ncbi:hypothetical protein CCZ01_01585 [Helicobacter monodelphidis]|uniref:DUF4214 domain-containing protein n=1 Tax=Helicobacter sp. 15-1451 TaxID=2004995 RepID=UPI000DCBE01C|nr:DUF4214 domain-containing protein [Helicobacter sp. 15-1451]RAX58913.1 hypothetical protein CCZ01_01585 [Helicobacter sp. 15-1451]
MALSKNETSQLYVSLFGRASEKVGSDFWSHYNQSTSIADTAKAMMQHTPLEGNSPYAFVMTLYKNALGKSLADDEAGIDFWAQLLINGMRKEELVERFIDTVVHYNAQTQQDKDALELFFARVEVSNYTAVNFTGALTNNDIRGLRFGDGLADVRTQKDIAGCIQQADALNAQLPQNNWNQTIPPGMVAGVTVYQPDTLMG